MDFRNGDVQNSPAEYILASHFILPEITYNRNHWTNVVYSKVKMHLWFTYLWAVYCRHLHVHCNFMRSYNIHINFLMSNNYFTLLLLLFLYGKLTSVHLHSCLLFSWTGRNLSQTCFWKEELFPFIVFGTLDFLGELHLATDKQIDY